MFPYRASNYKSPGRPTAESMLDESPPPDIDDLLVKVRQDAAKRMTSRTLAHL